MAIGKYFSLEEARNKGQLDRFAKAHPSIGNERKFDVGLSRMLEPSTQKKSEKDG
ncbi:MAG: hypothetical protein SH820_01545 [Xanthomonadales bacterium]|nr:hypothetical protein [Xanthomonadales bacterium]